MFTLVLPGNRALVVAQPRINLAPDLVKDGMKAYAVQDPQVSGQRITWHGVYLSRATAQYQSALRVPTEVVPVPLRVWLRWHLQWKRQS